MNRKSKLVRSNFVSSRRVDQHRHSLAQSRFEAPFDGIVTRRNVEVGENVVIGTMNNAGTVLLTVADMSVIEAEIEVDETDIPLVQLGQVARSRSTPWTIARFVVG